MGSNPRHSLKVGRDWWLSPVTLLLGRKNKGWSEVISAEIFKLGLWEEPDLVVVPISRHMGTFAMFLVLVALVPSTWWRD